MTTPPPRRPADDDDRPQYYAPPSPMPPAPRPFKDRTAYSAQQALVGLAIIAVTLLGLCAICAWLGPALLGKLWHQ
jgi:hypothetical protein